MHSESGYSYTNTRIKVKKSFLLKREDFHRLMKMSLPEIALYLEQGIYKKEVEELGVKFKGVNLVEYALNRNLERTLRGILKISIKQASRQIKLYLKRYDVYNVKTIMSGKQSGAQSEKILNELIACGELSREFLEGVVKKSADMNGAIELFKDTEYYDTLKKNSGDVAKMQDELDKRYYSQILQGAEQELLEYTRFEIWVKNTLNRLRGEKSAIKVELLPGERGARLQTQLKGDTVQNRVMLRKMLVTRGLKMVHGFKRNIRPAIGYFVAKENEIDNIRIISRGRHAGLPEEAVANQLVM